VCNFTSDGRDDDDLPETSSADHDSQLQHQQKGISRERTFQAGKSWSEVNCMLEDIGRKLSDDMQEKDLWARTLTVKVKLHTFDALSKARSLERSSLQSPLDLVQLASHLLAEMRSEFLREKKGQLFNVRLLGIRCSNFGAKGSVESSTASPGGEQQKIDSFLRTKSENDQAGSSHGTKLSPAPSHRFFTPVVHPNQMSMEYFLNSNEPEDPEETGRGAGGHGKKKRKIEHRHQQEEEEKVYCPICQTVSFPRCANAALNQHIDSCLSGTAIRQAAREESTSLRRPASSSSRSKTTAAADASVTNDRCERRGGRLTDYFGRRRSSVDTERPAARREPGNELNTS